MPDGIEEKLDPHQLADVIEFLRRPDRELVHEPSSTRRDTKR
jgi:hypothetical protein